MRYEKKFTFENNQISWIRTSIRNSKFGFSTDYPSRQINSIYLDSFNYDDAQDNIAGLSKRYKVRLRWYSDINHFKLNSFNDFKIEIKFRENAVGSKIVRDIELPEEILSSNQINIINHIRQQLSSKERPYLDHCTNFSLGVFYKREYYRSKAMDIRATLDSHINYWNPYALKLVEDYSSSTHRAEYGVLEFKTSKDNYEKNLTGLNELSDQVTPSRHSKYVVGLTLINK